MWRKLPNVKETTSLWMMFIWLSTGDNRLICRTDWPQFGGATWTGPRGFCAVLYRDCITVQLTRKWMSGTGQFQTIQTTGVLLWMVSFHSVFFIGHLDNWFTSKKFKSEQTKVNSYRKRLNLIEIHSVNSLLSVHFLFWLPDQKHCLYSSLKLTISKCV